MNFTIKQLRALIAIAETGSFRAAAEMLCLSPAAVSLLVRELESGLGFAVFERTTRRVGLSRAGREFLPAAQRLLRELNATVLSAREVQARSAGTVRVAAPLVIASAILPPVIAAFQAQHPDIAVRPVDASIEGLVQLVEEDQADLALGADRPTGTTIVREAICDTPWMLWCSPEHPLARRDGVQWRELEAYPLIAPGTAFEAVAAKVLDAAAGRHLTPAYAVTNITTALGLASAGLGVTVSPAYVGVVAKVLGLVGQPLTEPVLRRELCLFGPAKRPMAPAVDLFRRFAIEHLRRHHASA